MTAARRLYWHENARLPWGVVYRGSLIGAFRRHSDAVQFARDNRRAHKDRPRTTEVVACGRLPPVGRR